MNTQINLLIVSLVLSRPLIWIWPNPRTFILYRR
nr:MAG TPA: hypothetical protein [Caudoviricetes sp.]